MAAAGAAAAGRAGDEPKLAPSDDPKAGAAFDNPKVGAAAVVAGGAVADCGPNKDCDWNPNPVLVVGAGVAALKPLNADAPPYEKED